MAGEINLRILKTVHMKTMTIGNVVDVPLSEIKLVDANVRSDLDSANSKENLRELADSIKENGLLQPIVLSGVFGFPTYDVIVGQRRFRAHELLGETTIKAVFAGEVSKMDALVMSLSENLLRQEMNQADIAEAVTKLYIQLNRDEHAVQRRLGLSIRAIRGYINVEEQATDEIKQLIKQGKLSMADAKRSIAAAQGSAEKANAIAKSITKLTKHEKSRAVEFGRTNPEATADEIVKTAKTPRIEETTILTLSKKIAKALKDASQHLELEPEEIIVNAITEWLKINDFLVI